MRTSLLPILFVTINLVYGQLNFEGNPLTEDTIYTAEESQFAAEKTAKARSLGNPDAEDSYLLAAKALKAERSHNLYSANDPVGTINGANSSPRNDPVHQVVESQFENSYKTIHEDKSLDRNNPTTESRRQITYSENNEPVDQQSAERSESALMMFLNSKTPQESQIALQEYLDGKNPTVAPANPSESLAPAPPHISEIVLPGQQFVNVADQLNIISQNQMQQQQESLDKNYDSRHTKYYQQQQAGRNINYMGNFQYPVEKFLTRRGGPPVIRGQNPTLYARRRPTPYPGGYYRAQSRLGFPPGLRKGSEGGVVPPHGAELIYTNPPGSHGKFENYKDPYQDAGAWFPDASYPPPDVNVYRSQLYAQSYDPYYYNYIAKYGKIKPHLYGKFGKKEEGLLSELFSSFKKHGMKHVMHPMFLLGLGIPMITLMLSALVGKRSFGRSISGESTIEGEPYATKEQTDELMEKLQRALDCHEKSSSRDELQKCVGASEN